MPQVLLLMPNFHFFPSFPPPAQRSSQSGRGGPGVATPKTAHRSTAPAAHSGVKLHPPRKNTQLQSPVLLSPTSPAAQSQASNPPPHTSVLLSVVQSSSRSDQLSLQSAPEANAVGDTGEDELVPVRCIDTDAPKAPNVPLTADSGAETDVKTRTVQCLLEELKTLIAGQGIL